MRALWIVIACLALNGCAQVHNSPQTYLEKKSLPPPTPEHFQHCHAYGCKRISEVELSPQEWHSIETIFKPGAKDAAQERTQLTKAIGQFEILAGKKTGTEVDHYGTFMKLGDYQQDCVDESTNTTIYLSLLEQKGLIKFHTPAAPQVRLPIIHAGRWPHQTAVMTEIDTGTAYAVDSWFHDNGFPAEIVTLEEWKKGWKPTEHFTKTSDLEPKS